MDGLVGFRIASTQKPYNYEYKTEHVDPYFYYDDMKSEITTEIDTYFYYDKVKPKTEEETSKSENSIA